MVNIEEKGSVQTTETTTTPAASAPGPGAPLQAEAMRAALAGLRGHLESLAEEVDATRQKEGFDHQVKAMSLLWEYSPCNQWMIWHQCPEATRIASAATWRKLGRKLKPGVKAIEVFAPIGGLPPRYITVPVYDIKQTRGRRLRLIYTLTGGKTKLVPLLEGAAARLGIAVKTVGKLVIGRSLGGVIEILGRLTSRERLAVLAHELAHEILHQDPAWRARRTPISHAEEEMEAEATGYLVLKILGVPSTAPTYIAWQGGSGVMIAAAMGRIQRATRAIIAAALGEKPRRVFQVAAAAAAPTPAPANDQVVARTMAAAA
jgi:hypothetical protein